MLGMTVKSSTKISLSRNESSQLLHQLAEVISEMNRRYQYGDIIITVYPEGPDDSDNEEWEGNTFFMDEMRFEVTGYAYQNLHDYNHGNNVRNFNTCPEVFRRMYA